MNVEGIQNIHGFARGILEVHHAENIFVVCDNDASEELQELIDALSISEDRKYVIGTKEFEDAFADEALYTCWSQYHIAHDKACPENWSIENIRKIHEECFADHTLKFSEKIKALNAGGKKMTKPIFGSALAEFIEDERLPPRLAELFDNLY